MRFSWVQLLDQASGECVEGGAQLVQHLVAVADQPGQQEPVVVAVRVKAGQPAGGIQCRHRRSGDGRIVVEAVTVGERDGGQQMRHLADDAVRFFRSALPDAFAQLGDAVKAGEHLGQIQVACGGLGQLSDEAADLGRLGGDVQRQDLVLQQVPERVGVDAGVGQQYLTVGLVDQVSLGVPPPSHAAAADGGALAFRAVGQQHVQRGYADAPERLVARPHGAFHLRRLAGQLADRAGDQLSGFRHRADLAVVGGTEGAGCVDVDVGDAVLVEFFPELVGVPGGAGVAAGAVPDPPGDPHAALQLVLQLGQVAGQLQAGDVAGRVVRCPVVPRVDVAGHEHEIVACTFDLGHRHPHLAPAGDGHALQVGLDRSLFQGFTDTVAVGVGDGDDRDGRHPVLDLRGGRAPDVGDDAFVQNVLVAGPHVHVAERAGFLGREHGAAGAAFAQYDLAADRFGADLVHRVISDEHVAATLDRYQFGAYALIGGVGAEGPGLGFQVDRLAVQGHLQATVYRVGQVGGELVDGDRQPVAFQDRRDVIDGGVLACGARGAVPLDQLLEVGPHLAGRDAVDEFIDYFRHCWVTSVG